MRLFCNDCWRTLNYHEIETCFFCEEVFCKDCINNHELECEIDCNLYYEDEDEEDNLYQNY